MVAECISTHPTLSLSSSLFLSCRVVRPFSSSSSSSSSLMAFAAVLSKVKTAKYMYGTYVFVTLACSAWSLRQCSDASLSLKLDALTKSKNHDAVRSQNSPKSVSQQLTPQSHKSLYRVFDNISSEAYLSTVSGVDIAQRYARHPSFLKTCYSLSRSSADPEVRVKSVETIQMIAAGSRLAKQAVAGTVGKEFLDDLNESCRRLAQAVEKALNQAKSGAGSGGDGKGRKPAAAATAAATAAAAAAAAAKSRKPPQLPDDSLELALKRGHDVCGETFAAFHLLLELTGRDDSAVVRPPLPSNSVSARTFVVIDVPQALVDALVELMYKFHPDVETYLSSRRGMWKTALSPEDTADVNADLDDLFDDHFDNVDPILRSLPFLWRSSPVVVNVSTPGATASLKEPSELPFLCLKALCNVSSCTPEKLATDKALALLVAATHSSKEESARIAKVALGNVLEYVRHHPDKPRVRQESLLPSSSSSSSLSLLSPLPPALKGVSKVDAKTYSEAETESIVENCIRVADPFVETTLLSGIFAPYPVVVMPLIPFFGWLSSSTKSGPEYLSLKRMFHFDNMSFALSLGFVYGHVRTFFALRNLGEGFSGGLLTRGRLLQGFARCCGGGVSAAVGSALLLFVKDLSMTDSFNFAEEPEGSEKATVGGGASVSASRVGWGVFNSALNSGCEIVTLRVVLKLMPFSFLPAVLAFYLCDKTQQGSDVTLIAGSDW